MADVAETSPQETWTDPVLLFVPGLITQVQETLPAESALLGPRPVA